MASLVCERKTVPDLSNASKDLTANVNINHLQTMTGRDFVHGDCGRNIFLEVHGIQKHSVARTGF